MDSPEESALAVMRRFPGYTAHAAEAQADALRVAGEAGDDYAEPRHVLWCLMAREDAAVVRLLRGMGVQPERVREVCGVYPCARPRPERDIFVQMTEVCFHARETAKGLGDPRIGTAHLLAGLLTHRDTAQKLAQAGVTADKFKAELFQARRDHRDADLPGQEPLPGLRPSPGALRPAVVTWVGVWIIVQMLCGCNTLRIASVLPAMLLETVVRIGLFAGFYPALQRGSRDAWAATTALLFGESALISGLMVMNALWPMRATQRFTPDMLWISLFSLLCTGALVLLPVFSLTQALFAKRWWFGVGEREGWTVLRRRGGWVLLLMAVGYGGMTIAALTSRGGFGP